MGVSGQVQTDRASRLTCNTNRVGVLGSSLVMFEISNVFDLTSSHSGEIHPQGTRTSS